MKSCVAFTATALIVAATLDSAMGLAKYLDELPNGSSFSQALGHPDSDSSQYTDFATAFADAGHSWTAEFCAKTFPGSTMTNGAAFGDPCCTWAKDGKPDFTVTAFTTTPGEATTCASTAQASTASSTAASTASSTAGTSESTTTDAPAYTDAPVETEAPSTTSPSTTTPATTETPAYTDAPKTTDAPSTTASPIVTDAPQTVSPASGGCGVKTDTPNQNYRRFRH